MILARLLTPREFGIAAAAGFFTLLAGRLSALGFNAALVRAKVVLPTHLSTVFIVNLAVGVLTFSVLTAITPFVARFYDTPETGAILPVAAVAFLIVPFGTVPAAMLTREMRFRESAIIDWYYTLTFAGTTTLLAWLGFSYMSMVYGRLASMAVLTISRIAYVPWRPSFTFSKAALYELLSFGAGVHVKSLLDFTAQNIDNLVVGKLFGMASLGFYDKAFGTMNRFLVRLNTGGPGIAFRAFAIIQDEPARFRRAYGKVVMSSALLAFPIFAGLIAAAPQFIVVLFGERWRPAAAPFQLLCVAACLKLLNMYASSANQAVGRVWSEVWRQGLYVTLIVGGLMLLRNRGPVGAAAGVLFATAVMTVLMHVLLTSSTHLRWIDVLRPQLPGVLCAGGVGTTVMLVEFGLARTLGHPPAPWLLLGVQAIAAGIFYCAFVLFAPHPELRILVREVAEDLAPASVKRHRLVQLYLGTSSALT